MAVDEVLLASPSPRPTLRFYTWQPAALSLGYFQRWADFASLAGQPIVRRFSGGGAIHHADELTFSIAAPQQHPLYAGEVRQSYERVHDLLALALAEFGVSARMRGATPLVSDVAASAMCFHQSTDVDLAWDGAKGVGSAQRRKDERVLHHGSIKLGGTALEPGVATLRTRAPALTAEELAARIEAVFVRELGAVLEPSELDEGELERAERRASFYSSEAFLCRR
jgi:lipoate-protein ligase A